MPALRGRGDERRAPRPDRRPERPELFDFMFRSEITLGGWSGGAQSIVARRRERCPDLPKPRRTEDSMRGPRGNYQNTPPEESVVPPACEHFSQPPPGAGRDEPPQDGSEFVDGEEKKEKSAHHRRTQWPENKRTMLLSDLHLRYR